MSENGFERSGELFVQRPDSPGQLGLPNGAFQRALTESELKWLGWPDKPSVDLVADFTQWERQRLPEFEQREQVRVNGERFEFTLSNGEPVEVLVVPSRVRNTAAFDGPDTGVCFLDRENQDPMQRAMLIAVTDANGSSYSWLTNPFPNTPDHATIVSSSHTEKLFLPGFDVESAIAQGMGPSSTYFDNHRLMGASAKHHAHGQRTSRQMPIIDSIDNAAINIPGERMAVNLNTDVSAYMPMSLIGSMVVVETEDRAAMRNAVATLVRRLTPEGDMTEPPANHILTTSQGRLRLVYFPRDEFRPPNFEYKLPSGETVRSLRVSKAALEMSRLLIVPDVVAIDELNKPNDEIVPKLEAIVAYGSPRKEAVYDKLGAGE